MKLLENYWKTTEKLLKNYWKLLKNYWKTTENHWKFIEKLLKNLSENYWKLLNSIKETRRLIRCHLLTDLGASTEHSSGLRFPFSTPLPGSPPGHDKHFFSNEYELSLIRFSPVNKTWRLQKWKGIIVIMMTWLVDIRLVDIYLGWGHRGTIPAPLWFLCFASHLPCTWNKISPLLFMNITHPISLMGKRSASCFPHELKGDHATTRVKGKLLSSHDL